MNDRERFRGVMRYQPVDRPPLHIVGPWPDTLERWYSEGLPRDVDLNEYLGVKPLRSSYIGCNTGIYPWFEESVLSEDETFTISIDIYGRTVRNFKSHTSMPEWLDFPVKTRDDLQRLLDEHFDIDDLDARFPSGWEAKVRQSENEEAVTIVDGGCYYWNLRSLAGVEGASFLLYDAPDLVDELFERINVVCLEGIRRATALAQVDVIGFGEDVAYKTGPLISPVMFRKLILPRYKKVMDLAHAKGIDLTWYDSDGDLRQLIPDYLNVGITNVAPCEVAAGMSPAELRRQFGRELRMMGGIDKREIAKGRKAIDAEIERNRPVIEEGGYLPAIDHSVSADISFDNHRYYVEAIQKAVGGT